MNDIIRIKNDSYGRYEQLLLRRDELSREAFKWQREYIREFGNLVLEVFNKKIECIRKKKLIEFCQREVNYGRKVDGDELNVFLEEEMREFEEQLAQMTDEYEMSSKGKTISELDVMRIRKIYHKLVKLIHPDINPLTEENESLMELWMQAKLAYNCNDLKLMEEVEFRVMAALEQIGMDDVEIEIPDIEEKIKALEEEIFEIMDTEPYTYQFLLQNEEAIEEKKNALNEELIAFEEYSKQLEDIINQLMLEGVNIKWQMKL